MKVFFVVANLGGGGTERVIVNLANEFVKKNIATEILMTAGEQIEYNVDKKVKISVLGGQTQGSVLKRLQRIYKLRKCLKEDKGCNVLSFGTETNLFSIIATWRLPVNLIISERNDPNHCSYKALRNVLYWFAPKHVFQTEDAKNCFGKHIRNRGVVIPNPLDENLMEPYEGVREKRIAAVGRLTEQKNHSLLLRAFADFQKKFPEYVLEIYGKGELKEQLQKEAASLMISEKVYFAGFQANVLDKIKNVQMYVLSSDYEGISNSLAEAMAIGLPVISTDCPIGGSKMCIQNDYNGILVPVNNKEKLTEAMELLASNIQKAEEMGKHAAEIRAVLSIRKISEQWLEVLN